MTINLEHCEPLSAEREVELGRAIEAGVIARRYLDTGKDGYPSAELRAVVTAGQRAWNEFYRANIRLVAGLASRWASRTGLPRDDLFQEGCVALGQTLMAWDYQRGFKFSTLAWTRVNAAMAHASRTRCGEYHGSAWMARKLSVVQRLRQRNPGAGLPDIARDAGLAVGDVAMLLASQTTANCDDVDVAASPPSQLSTLFHVWFESVPPFERMILARRYGIHGPAESRAAVAEDLGMSVSQLRKTEAFALHLARCVADDTMVLWLDD